MISWGIKIVDAIRRNPVRVYAFISGVVAAIVALVPSFPAALVLAVIAGVLGVGGEITRSKVTPV